VRNVGPTYLSFCNPLYAHLKYCPTDNYTLTNSIAPAGNYFNFLAYECVVCFHCKCEIYCLGTFPNFNFLSIGKASFNICLCDYLPI